MDPKELAKLYEKKNAEIAAAAAEQKAQQDAQKAQIKKRIEQGRVALRDVVIPYFQELVAEFPKGHFKFNSATKMDLETRAPVAVSFQIKNGLEHVIEVIQDDVKIYNQAPRQPQRPGARRIAMRIFSGDAEPFIAGPSDLTREKLGKLVEMAIK